VGKLNWEVPKFNDISKPALVEISHNAIPLILGLIQPFDLDPNIKI
jgi:hypothetical protein